MRVWNHFKQKTGWVLGPWETAAILIVAATAMHYGIPAYFRAMVFFDHFIHSAPK